MTLLVADSATTDRGTDNQTISASGDRTDSVSQNRAQTPADDELLVVGDLSSNGLSLQEAKEGGELPLDDAVTMQKPIAAASGEADSDNSASAETQNADENKQSADGQESNSVDGSAAKSDDAPPMPQGPVKQEAGNPTPVKETQAPESKTNATTPKQATQPTTTAPPAPKPTDAPKTNSAPSTGSASKFEPMRNNNGKFGRQANTPSNQLNVSSLMESVSPVDNGGNTAGQFRIACEYSHFNYDDPIVFPGVSGQSHFHMYFGNTRTDANTTKDSLLNSGGGSCNGFELNRSSYWTPALLDGKGNAIVPDQIIIYYKTKFPNQVQPMPQGLQIIGGNANGQDFSPSETLFWSCGSSGHSYGHTNRIPNCGGDAINATIAFPQCWDGKNLTSSDFTSHMKQINESSSCPGSHPVRLPQLTYLLYFPPGNSSSWYLSSDREGSFNTGPGATLHGDWMGAWHEETMNLWLNTCVRRARNCSYGQTGGPKKLAALNPLQTFGGNNTIRIPK